jgi:hypothetical protein
MAWSTPLTAVSNAALTAAQWNASVRDNLLETAPAKFTTTGQLFVSTGANAGAVRSTGGATVATSETTASTTYADLATVGPAVTVTTGARAAVFVTASVANSTIGANTFAAYDVTGATTIGANDARAINLQPAAANQAGRFGAALFETGLTPGSNTFTMRYKVGSGTGTYLNRTIVVIPL